MNSTSYSSSGLGPLFVVMGIIYLAILIFYLLVAWKLYVKMGEPGWKCLIPFYNLYIWYQKILGNGLWMFVLLVPFINAVLMTFIKGYTALLFNILIFIFMFFFNIVTLFRTSKSFGRGVGTAIGLFFLSAIFYPILAFGSAEYNELPAWDIKNPFN